MIVKAEAVCTHEHDIIGFEGYVAGVLPGAQQMHALRPELFQNSVAFVWELLFNFARRYF